MATLKVNGVTVSTDAIVGIYIDKYGRIIASTNFLADVIVDIPNNHIGATPGTRNGKGFECDITVAEAEAVGSEPPVQPRTISALKICYTQAGLPYRC